MSFILKTPSEVANEIANKVKEKRLKLNISQRTLASKSGVSYSTLKKFEQKGQISLESLLKLAIALGDIDTFEHLFNSENNTLPTSLDELLDNHSRKRGRK